MKLDLSKLDETKIFNYALLVSFGFHVITLVGLSVSSARLSKKPKPFQVTYHTEAQQTPQQKETGQTRSVQQDKARETVKKNLAKMTIPSSFVNDPVKLNKKDGIFPKKQPSLLDTSSVRPKVSIPVFKSEKMTNPEYLSYENKIRNKIRNRAYLLLEELMTESDLQEGEVYLTFLIGTDGSLREIKIIEEKTKANDFLRKISIMSVKESSPFPPMPDTKYPEITYNITISYEINNEQ